MPNIQPRIISDCHKVLGIWNALLKKTNVSSVNLHKQAGTLGAMRFLNKMHLHYHNSPFFSVDTLEKIRQKINIGLQTTLAGAHIFDPARNTRRSECDIDLGYNLSRNLYKREYPNAWLAPQREMTKMCQKPSATNQSWQKLNRMIIKELRGVMH